MENMTTNQFKEIMKSNVLLPATCYDEQQDYFQTFQDFKDAGANFLIAPTYLGHDISEQVAILRAVQKACDGQAFVCGAIARPKNSKVFSNGLCTYDTYTEEIKKQITDLDLKNQCAALFLYDFRSLVEIKCAVYAAKELCGDMPICPVLSFDNAHTLQDGSSVAVSVITLQSLGVSAIGFQHADCDEMLEILMEAEQFSAVPFAVFPSVSAQMKSYEYAEYAQSYINHKTVMFGNGQNTSAAHIREVAKELWQAEPFLPDFPNVLGICVGQEIYMRDFLENVVSKNNKILDLNLDSVEKTQDIDKIMQKLQTNTPLVCFRSKDTEYLERAIRLYPGRPAVVSDEYGEITAREYGAMVFADNREEESL